ncbi:MAG TPA: non-homologous end-joining DNA ligase, partial [Vulgatibacter sp.]
RAKRGIETPEYLGREAAKPIFGEVRSPPRTAARERRRRGPAPLAGARIELTHPDRVVYPAAGYTKADVFEYMGRVAPLLVDALDGRPLSLQQWPQGVMSPGFFRQDVDLAPDFVTRVPIDHEDGGRVAHHAIVDKPETVLWLANQSAFTLHMWSSRLPRLDLPTWVIFDLDPGGGTWAHMVDLALTLRGFLEELGLRSFPKTSGKRGLHLIVPIRPGPSHEDATRFAVEITTALAHVMPEVATVERMKARRGGRLYLDALQNGYGKTIVAPYSLRDTPQATVSAPLDWSEVTVALDPRAFTLRSMPGRIDEVGDLFAEVRRTVQALPTLEP